MRYRNRRRDMKAKAQAPFSRDRRALIGLEQLLSQFVRIGGHDLTL